MGKDLKLLQICSILDTANIGYEQLGGDPR